MKILTTFLAVILIINVAMADSSKRHVYPPCEGQGCSAVAVTIPLEETSFKKNLKIQIGSLVVEIPPNVTKVDLARSPISATVFRYETAPPIMISTETDETLSLRELTSKPISLFESMEIIFTKTLKDSDVTSKYDEELLNKLMLIKKELLGGERKAFVYSKKQLKIYYISHAGEPYKNLAWAIDPKFPNQALKIASNLSENDFIAIIYSAVSLKAKEK